MNKTKLFESYMTKNLDNAYRFAFTYVRNKEDAEDILNESVVKAMRAIHSLRNPDYLKPWFYKIIANTALSHIRAKSKTVYMDYEDIAALNVAEDDYSDLDFMELIEKLDSKYKSVLVLKYFENMTIAEIADVLETSESTVKSRLYRALRMLRVDAEEGIS